MCLFYSRRFFDFTSFLHAFLIVLPLTFVVYSTGFGFQAFSVTPTYSLNRLFSEFFNQFGGAILELCETISGGWGRFWEEKQRTTIQKKVGRCQSILLDRVDRVPG